METKIYSIDGKEAGTLKLPERVFNAPWNANMVHTVVSAMQANARTASTHTKNRGEVRGGGRKPWRQKGTGRARHGSKRSPIWVGGGISHGPRNERSHEQKINRKARAAALFAVLSKKLRDGEVLFVDTFGFSEPKTARAKTALGSLAGISGFAALATRRRNAALIALGARDEVASKSFRNFGSISVDLVQNLNPVDVLSYKYLVVTAPQDAIAFLEKRGAGAKKEAVAQKRAPRAAKAQVKAAPKKRAPRKAA
jgi:large subunit ribosomal protein L4